ncbi:hypothetical protein D9V86_09595 [Bacteroidetes/Chlorobi group bacterium ChocPot_Mid]|nr:MAG: hypothetical protein D9V86_09595 [Bacteroidetes/Chlorobi group bacterium ChocPot_Mid]
MTTYQLELIDGHPIIKEDENIILIDTGSPISIHNLNQLNFNSELFETSSNYMGLTIEIISDLLGFKITTLLGADILSKYNILFDYKDKLIAFSKDDIAFTGNEIKISSFMGIPIIDLSISEQNVKLFLDTGAKLSYLSQALTENLISIGTEEDFYPGVGKFKTECYEIITNLGMESFNVKYGNLPLLLQMTLLISGTNAIIGSDFFNNFKIMLDTNNKRLKYLRNQ